MQQTSQPNRRHTPGRRRPARHATQSPAISSRKTYASENDAADLSADVSFHKMVGVEGPRTPRKSRSPAPSSLNPGSQPKPRSSNKGRPKNVSVSPGPVKPGGRTPPQTAVLPKTNAAFAGATFHASPAPSSLPIPSFLAKSIPESPTARESPRPAVSQEPSPPPTDSEMMPTPLHKSCPPDGPQPREESPLDILFQADRAEKAKARRASSANATMLMSGPFSPPSQPISPRQEANQGSPGAKDSPVPQSRRAQALRNSTMGISSAELNGAPFSKSLGPAFSTPYQERIRAARSTDRPGGDGRAQASSPEQQQQQSPFVDRSAALKDFLFGSQKPKAPPTTVPSTTSPPAGFYSPSPPAGSGPRPVAQHIYTPPTPGSEKPSADLQAMEATLRRVLRLDLPPGLPDAKTT